MASNDIGESGLDNSKDGKLNEDTFKMMVTKGLHLTVESGESALES